MDKTEFVYMAVIAATPERVWQCLTTPQFTRQYWHGTEIKSDFNKGSTVEFLTESGDAGVCGEILEADPPRRLSYTWQFMEDPECMQDPPSRVTFELQALDTGTRLTVIHDQLEPGCKTAELVTFGWPHVISGLKTLAESGKAVDFSRSEECPGQQAKTA